MSALQPSTNRYSPRDTASISDRLICLLLNALQEQWRWPLPDSGEHFTESQNRMESVSTLSLLNYSAEISEVGLQNQPGLDSVELTVGFAKQTASDYVTYYVTGSAWPKSTQGVQFPIPTVPLELKISTAMRGFEDQIRFWDNLGWSRIQKLIERQACLQYNNYGEARTPEETLRINTMLGPVLPELAGMRVRLFQPPTTAVKYVLVEDYRQFPQRMAGAGQNLGTSQGDLFGCSVM